MRLIAVQLPLGRGEPFHLLLRRADYALPNFRRSFRLCSRAHLHSSRLGRRCGYPCGPSVGRRCFETSRWIIGGVHWQSRRRWLWNPQGLGFMAAASMKRPEGERHRGVRDADCAVFKRLAENFENIGAGSLAYAWRA